MFENNGKLRVFSTEILASLDHTLETGAQPLADHRLAYLDYRGEVSGDRGHVQEVVGGTYLLTHQDEHEFHAEIHWSDHSTDRRARVRFYRSSSDHDAGWRLRLER